MTIAKGQSWGVPVPRPDNLRIVPSDVELAEALASELAGGPEAPTAMSGGDMFRTIGSRAASDRTELLQYPVDVVRATIDGGAVHTAAAHILLRSPWRRGGWLRGPVLAIMNAEFVGEFDVAPRGHPNDGRAETLMVQPAMSARQRLEVRRRLRNASHLPHPLITTQSVRSADWSFQTAMVLIVDGVTVGRCTELVIEVVPDAGVLYG